MFLLCLNVLFFVEGMTFGCRWGCMRFDGKMLRGSFGVFVWVHGSCGVWLFLSALPKPFLPADSVARFFVVAKPCAMREDATSVGSKARKATSVAKPCAMRDHATSGAILNQTMVIQYLRMMGMMMKAKKKMLKAKATNPKRQTGGNWRKPLLN